MSHFSHDREKADDQREIPTFNDEFEGLDLNQFDGILFPQSTDENNSHQHSAEENFSPGNSYLITDSTFNSNNSIFHTDDSVETFSASNTGLDSYDSETETDDGESFLNPMMQPLVENTLRMLRDEIPYSTGDTVNFPLRFNVAKETLGFEYDNLEENPFKNLSPEMQNGRKPLLIVLMRDCLKRWTNPLTPKLLSKLADREIQPVVFSMEEPGSRHYIYDLLKKLKTVRNGFLSGINLDCVKEMNKVMQYLVMNTLAKVIRMWSLNILMVDSNPFDIIRHNWIVEFAYIASIPLIYAPPFGHRYSSRGNSVGQQDDAVVQKAYDSICRFLSVHKFHPEGYRFIKGADGCISAIFVSDKKYNLARDPVEVVGKDSDSDSNRNAKDENILRLERNDNSGSDEMLLSFLRRNVDRFHKSFNKRQRKIEKLRKLSASHEYRYILSTNIPKVIPLVYEDPAKLVKFVVEQCSQRFIEAVVKAFGGYLENSQVDRLKFIIVSEGCTKIMELLTVALWFWDNCALATWQMKYSNRHHLAISCNSVKYRCQLSKKDPIFNVWLAEGIRHIIRSAESKCVLVDVPRPGSFSKKELSFLLFGQLDLPPQLKIKVEHTLPQIIDRVIMINQCDMEEENVVNSVEGILDKIHSHLNGHSHITFAKARLRYRELGIDDYYAVSDKARDEMNSRNSVYYMNCMKQGEMIASRRKYFNQKK